MLKKIGIVTLLLNGVCLHAMHLKWLKPISKAYVFKTMQQPHYSSFLFATKALHNQRDLKDETLLFEAIKTNNLKLLKEALSQKDECAKGFSGKLSKGGYTQEAYELAQKIGSPEIKKIMATEYLRYALENKSLYHVVVALKAGANIEYPHMVSLFQTYTALGLALRTNDITMVQAILEKNPNTKEVFVEYDYGGGAQFYSAEDLAPKGEITTIVKNHLLFKAIEDNDKDAVNNLLAQDCNINKLKWDGKRRTSNGRAWSIGIYPYDTTSYSALGWALKSKCNIEIISAILTKKPDLYCVIEECHTTGDYYGGESWKCTKKSITKSLFLIQDETIKKLIKMHVRENDMQLFLQYPSDEKNKDKDYSIPMIMPRDDAGNDWVFEKNPELRKEFAKALYDAAREERTSDRVDEDE